MLEKNQKTLPWLSWKSLRWRRHLWPSRSWWNCVIPRKWRRKTYLVVLAGREGRYRCQWQPLNCPGWQMLRYTRSTWNISTISYNVWSGVEAASTTPHHPCNQQGSLINFLAMWLLLFRMKNLLVEFWSSGYFKCCGKIYILSQNCSAIYVL